MIRIRGPVGTLRVLMLPGESGPCPQDPGEGAPEVSGGFGEDSDSLREARRDQ